MEKPTYDEALFLKAWSVLNGTALAHHINCVTYSTYWSDFANTKQL